ncbi:hypothetical protein ACK1JC_10580 [Acinetobacter sp. TY2]|uniref:hypothetical protein n=1 Tax=Acinetobacter sp. TY2 TaxID=3387403 RepID=UPI00391797D2
MNLIEKLGIEKCRAIVDGAPEDGTHFKLSFGLSIFYLLSSDDGASPAGLWIDDGDESHWSVSSYKNFELFVAENRFISLKDIRTEIADYDNHWYGQSEEKELEQYAILRQEKIQGGAVLVGNFTVIQQQLQSEINNCSEKDSSEISILDCCTDIRNHISPRAIVWDIASGEDWSVEIDR